MPKVPATRPAVLNVSAAKPEVQQFPSHTDTSDPTIPRYCSSENQMNPNAAIQTAIIAAESASFLMILKKSRGVNSCKARPRIIRAMVCPPAFPPVSIITGIKAARMTIWLSFVSNEDKTNEENVPKMSKTIIHGTHFLTIWKDDVSK